ncbi:MAG: DNA-processing protein DprA [Clostridiaceae bacterium]|nr:DNA-processing protein DprA [Eubacteriales bacterium]
MLDIRSRYALWLAFALKCSPSAYFKLVEHHGSAREVFYAAADNALLFEGRNAEKVRAELRQKAKESYIDSCLNYLEKHDIKTALFDDENYPELLRHIHNPPPVLFVKGTLKSGIALPLAIIGSRKCTNYGKKMAFSLASELVGAGACVVSGLAYGIDAQSAAGALSVEESDYPTIAVLGCGVDIVYPKENEALYDKIAERGAVVSEFLPGTKPHPSNFPRRNRIISGMSRGLVVVEAASRSGTSITANYALEQGRDVFAVPGRVTDPMSEGTNRMIADGAAKLTLCAADVLEEYGLGAYVAAARAEKKEELTGEQKTVYDLLKAGERSFDELSELTGIPIGTLNSTLTELEFSGIIKQSPGRVYEI